VDSANGRIEVNGLDAESGPIRHGPKPNLHQLPRDAVAGPSARRQRDGALISCSEVRPTREGRHREAPPLGSSAGLVVHLGQLESVCLLHVVRPVLGEAWCWEADGSVEGDAGVALITGFDVEVPEPEPGEPVERSDERGVFGGAFAEPDGGRERSCRGDVPVWASPLIVEGFL